MSLNGYIADNTIQRTPPTIEEYLIEHLSKVSVEDLVKFANLKEYPDDDIACVMEHELEVMTVKIQDAIDEGNFSE